LWRAVRQMTGLESGLTPALVTAALTILIAWLSYRYVEKRFMAMGRSRRTMVPV
jgi:peptidoglycan/LPS O-acetylase OafA/YrhL